MNMSMYRRCKYCQRLSKNLSYIKHKNDTTHLFLICPCKPKIRQYREYEPGLAIPTTFTKKQLKAIESGEQLPGQTSIFDIQ